MTRPIPALMSSCPICEGNFETCRCTGGFMQTVLTPRAGVVADEIGRQDYQSGDDGRGYERDETDRFHQVVRHLVSDGDRRADAAGRQVRRTFAEMAPGQTRQPVLRMTRELTFVPTASKAGADDACVLCGWWTCRCGGAAPASTPSLRAVAS
ncbi:hypothetical protein OG323_37815 (plasmid) [Streptomyces cyaneofuscatus]|uniref:hypothetical protein n=1 Tax=Streptomyces cyaneofuscatus TaxID=66883 RepID=UPI002F91BBCA|nr:hypothetical protein OG323_37815 [Streptomyces cyaneofuscatus]